MGNPTTPVLSVVPEPPKYNVYDLVSLAFRLARKSVSHSNYKIFGNFFEIFRNQNFQVLSLSEICEMACRLNPHLTKVTQIPC